MIKTGAKPSLKVIVADDHPMFRRGLAVAVKNIPIVSEVAEASDGIEVLQLLKSGKYNFVLLDVKMPNMDGFATVRNIREMYPDIPTIAISMIDDVFTIRQMYLAGSHGYLIKNADESEIQKAIDTVLAGKKYFNTSIVERLTLESEEETLKKAEHDYALTAADIRLLRLISEGKSNKDIANAFNVGVRTAEWKRLGLYKKINVNNTAGAIRFATQNHLLES